MKPDWFKKRPLFWVGTVASVIVFFILLSALSGWAVKWLWMRQMGYDPIFWRLLSIQWILFGLTFSGVFLYLWVNLRFALKSDSAPEGNAVRISSKMAKAVAVFLSLFVALIFARVFYGKWDTYLRFFWGGGFGQTDPIYGRDVGFYLFCLPFYELIQNGLLALTLTTLIFIFLAYLSLGTLQMQRLPAPRPDPTVVRHLSLLFVFFSAALAWGFYLDRFELLYATRGVVYGVGYTADHITKMNLWVMLCISVALGILMLFNLFKPRFKTALIGAGTYFLLYFILISVIPGLVQKFKVSPSELELETPYLKHNIRLTRKAFQLDRIREKAYPALTQLTKEDIPRNQETIDNIRLWDWRPILQTYRQTQEIRLYYRFYEVDVDRYHTEDGFHQVMLSGRELANKLPHKAATWVNERLQFTHGYGLVMNFVSKEAEGGFPQYIIENIPPQSRYGLTVARPAIYYGEKTAGYRIVATGVKEFDYPKGNKNVYADYKGDGGIPLDSFLKRVLFAWSESDINILLTSYLEPRSRIQIWRRIHERVSKIVPFLKLDNDPYLALSEGKLYWIQDAYTVSSDFPYSEPHKSKLGSPNYIRNSVKVVEDTYNGVVRFYIMDPDDPVLQVYRRAFPGVFRDLSELPGDLKRHLRYPEDLFTIQADMYKTYHMTDPQVFYNQEDLWTSSEEKYAGSSIPMQPYYILMRLPGTKELQYILMMPFTPQERDNMVAWMAAKCDFPQYGHVLVYRLPKERLTLGPIQIEAMIDQNTAISEQLSLWDQKGSRVIRGNLVIIPVDNAFLYVEPVYLTAEGTNIPQLKRVIAVSGNKVIMAPTLHQAISALFGASPSGRKGTRPLVQTRELRNAARTFHDAQTAMEKGQWEAFGKAMEDLKGILAPEE
ncbi:MAG: UPF0182 family protein [Deltaproteobacteria bacterium]